MTDMQDFQNAGEPYRQQLGIDGTAGDAQDVKHLYTVPVTIDGIVPECCIVCGLSGTAQVHQP